MTPPWDEFRPDFARHVLGRYARRTYDSETGQAEEQPWTVTCEKCGDSFRGVCATGQPRKRIQKFAVLHLHRDPLAPY